jgi:hypothetical protein
MSTWVAATKEYMESAVAGLLNANSPRATQPAWITTALRPHQLTLLEAARRLEGRACIGDIHKPTLVSRYGVIADRVGSGKSLVALSLVRDDPVASHSLSIRENGWAQYLRAKETPPPASLVGGLFDGSEVDIAKRLRALAVDGFTHLRGSLFVVPHNVVQQWEEYIKAQTSLSAYVVRRTKDCDYDRAGFLRDVMTADLVLVSCTMFKKFRGALEFNGLVFERLMWGRVFLDEADTLVFPVRQSEISTRFLWLITGSWLNVLFPSGIYSWYVNAMTPDMRALVGDGTVAGVRSSMNIVSQAITDGRDIRFLPLTLRNAEAWINESLSIPEIHHEAIICQAPANVGVLQEFITPAALEALHAGDTAGALAALGLKASSKETLADAVTAGLRAELDQARKLLAFKSDMEYSTAAAKKNALEREQEKVARLEEKLADLEARIASVASATCPICYDAPRTPTLTPCCRQTFCLECLCECMKSKSACPLCRQKVGSIKHLLVVGEEEESMASSNAEMLSVEPKMQTKGAALLKLLSESTDNDRILVFSAHEASFKGLKEILAARGIKCEMLMGSAARVEKLRTQFRAGTVRVLCMNARHVGAGINLEAATHVVLYHKMNVELERQVIGRAVRFERATELQVVHLVHEGETATSGGNTEVIVHV